MQTRRDIAKKALSMASIMVGTVILTGCASLNLLDPPINVATQAESNNEIEPPPDWVVPAPDALPTTDWVRAFPDPILIELVDEALRRNTNIGSAYAQLDAAIAGERVSRADRVPSVTGSAGLSRTEQANEFIPDNTGISSGLNASWEPDFWGRIADSINASELESEASAIDIAAARLSITGQVAQSWFSFIEARLLVDLSVSDIETQERALRLTQRRFEAGLTDSSDVRLARTALAQSQALQASRMQALSSFSRQIEILAILYLNAASRFNCCGAPPRSARLAS